MPARVSSRLAAAGRLCLWSVSATALCAAAGDARAADWFAGGLLGESLEYDDNIGLNSDDEVSDLSSRVFAGLDFGGETEIAEVGLKARAAYTVFLDERDLDSDDQRVVGYGRYVTPLGTWGLSAAYDRDTTRTRDEDDTGQFILANVRRHEVTVKPSWFYQFTPSDKAVVRGEYNEVFFEEQLTDYRQFSGETGWAHKLGEADEIDLFALASLTEPDSDVDRKTQVYGLQTGWNTSPLRGLDVRIALGAYWARTTFDPPSGRSSSFNNESSVGALPAVSVSYQIDPRSTLALSYARTIRPSGNGEVLERDTVDASFRYNWNRRGSLGLDLRYRNQRSLDDDGRADRDFIRVVPSVTWQFTDTWSLRGAYRFRWQSLQGQDDDAFSNAVFVTLSYQPLDWVIAD